MLRVLPPAFQPVLQQIRLRGFFFVGGKTPKNLLFNSFCSKVVKQVARFTVTQVVHVVNITLFLLYRTLEQSEGEYDSVQ